MAKTSISLSLNRVQRSQFFAHLLVYLLHLTMNPSTPRQQADRETLQELASRLYQGGLEAGEQRTLLLSLAETQVIRSVFTMLQSLYEQESQGEASDHLAACLALLQEAERPASASQGSEERDG